jgi:hypothetical protein
LLLDPAVWNRLQDSHTFPGANGVLLPSSRLRTVAVSVTDNPGKGLVRQRIGILRFDRLAPIGLRFRAEQRAQLLRTKRSRIWRRC